MQPTSWIMTWVADPITLASSIPEQQSVFSKFVGYWKGWEGKHIDGVTFLWIKDSATQRLMLENGELDIMMQPLVMICPLLPPRPVIRFSPVIAQSLWQLPSGSPIRRWMTFLCEKRLRWLSTLAITSKSHWVVMGSSLADPWQVYLPFFNTEIPLVPFDIEGAKALMSEAGYPDGGFTVKLAYESENEEKQRALEMLQSNWGQLGVQIEPMGMDFMAQASMMADKNSEPDVYIDYIWPTAPDPDPALRPFFYGPLKDFGNNAAYWSDPEVDKLFDEGHG